MTMTQEILAENLTPEQKLALNLLTINTAINTLQEDMGQMKKIVITGNGDLPLREQVRNHDGFIKDMRYWTRFLFGALIMQTLAFLSGVVIAVVRFLPVLEQLAASK